MKLARPCVLTINGGSSSIKFALFESDESLVRVLEGSIEGVGLPKGDFTVKGLNKADNFSRAVALPDHPAAVGLLMDWIQERIERGALTAVGHRVVHGGPKYWEPQRITPEMIGELRQLSPFDPEHLPEEILLTEAFHRRFPEPDADRLLRYGVSSRYATRSASVRNPTPIRGKGRSTLRFSRFVLHLFDAGTRTDRGREGGDRTRHPRSPRQRCEHGGRAWRTQH